MVPALVAPLAKGAASLVGWEAGKRSLSKIVPKARGALNNAKNWVNNNLGRAGFGAGGTAGGLLGGFGLSSIFDTLGIQDGRLRLLTSAAVVIGVIYAIGQLFDVQVGS
jgi:L-aminopeptidase/D-esterase-like protein